MGGAFMRIEARTKDELETKTTKVIQQAKKEGLTEVRGVSDVQYDDARKVFYKVVWVHS